MNRPALSLLDEGERRAGDQAPSWENYDAVGGGAYPEWTSGSSQCWGTPC